MKLKMTSANKYGSIHTISSGWTCRRWFNRFLMLSVAARGHLSRSAHSWMSFLSSWKEWQLIMSIGLQLWLLCQGPYDQRDQEVLWIHEKLWIHTLMWSRGVLWEKGVIQNNLVSFPHGPAIIPNTHVPKLNFYPTKHILVYASHSFSSILNPPHTILNPFRNPISPSIFIVSMTWTQRCGSRDFAIPILTPPVWEFFEILLKDNYFRSTFFRRRTSSLDVGDSALGVWLISVVYEGFVEEERSREGLDFNVRVGRLNGRLMAFRKGLWAGFGISKRSKLIILMSLSVSKQKQRVWEEPTLLCLR